MSTIKISEMELFTELTEAESEGINGGWIAAAALGLGTYVAFTSEKERLLHRDIAAAGLAPSRKNVTKAVVGITKALLD